MHFVLVQPPLDRKGIVSISAPLGLPYIASVLESKGETVSIVASDAEGLGVEATAERVLSYQPDVVGFSIGTFVATSSFRIASILRARAKRVILIAGGPHSTVLPEDVLNNGIDFVVIGEGEKTIGEFVDFLRKEIKLSDVNGIAYWSDGKIIYNKEQTMLDNLDDLPPPAWHLFPIDKYKSEFKQTGRNLPIMTSRGCPGQCIFCYKGLFGKRFRARSPANIISEIRYLKDFFSIGSFDIIDDSFTALPKRAIEFCTQLKSEKINLHWGLPSGIRIDTVSEELFTAFKDAGCLRIGFGVESGNESILKIIRKNITKDQIRTSVTLAKQLGFETSCFFMVGNLGETEQTINDTIRFANELDPDVAQFTMAIPYPGSEMFSMLKSQDRIVSYNWDYYDYFKSGHQVFKHENLKFDLIQRKLGQAYRSFYFRPKYIIRKIRALNNFEKIIKIVKAFFRLLSMLK